MSRSATRFLAVLCMLLLPSLASAARFPDAAPTPTFATMSGNPTVNGAPVAPGDELAVWSVHLGAGETNRWEKTLVGHSLADGGGSLSSFPVYGDDPSTPDTVEGTRGGEEIALVLWRASEGKLYSAYVDRATEAASRIIWQSGGSIDISAIDFREGQRVPLRNGQWNLVSYGVLSGFHTGPIPTNAQLKKADGSAAVSWTALSAIGDAFPLRSIAGRYDAVYTADADGSRLYMPSSPSTATLTYIAPGYGLNIKMKADNTTALSWMSVLGAPARGGESLDLQPGWTLAGYWDNQLYVEDGTDASGVLMPVETSDNVALTSFGDLWSQGIGASYAQVTSFDAFDPNGVTIWDPANAGFSTLRYAAPGYGYWINMYAAGTLRYPFSSAPMGVAAVAGDTAVTLSWKAVPGASSYRIYWSNIPGVRKGTGSSIAISGTSHVHGSLTNGVPYYYVVTAIRPGDIESNESSEVSATPTATFPAPAVSAMAPAEGYESDLVFIDGSGFLPGDTAVSFGAVPATAASVTESQIIAIVPAGAASGPISITTPGGTVATAPFTVKQLPGIASVAPLRGAAGAVVTVTGTGFEAGAIVEFNGVPSAQVTVLDGTRIQATVPDGATDGPLTIVSGGIIMTSADLFRVVSVTGVAPVAGPVGAAFAVTGTNFDGAARLYFANGIAADNVVVTGTTRIDARVPFGAASGALRVETAGLSGVVLSPVAFTVIPPPAVASISPASGPVGSIVTLAGVNLSGLSGVSFGGVAAVVTASTDSQVTAVVPAVAPGPLTVTVTAAGGSAGIAFTVVAPPSISGFTPASGTPGSLVTVTGANFDNSARLFIGAAQASIVSATAGQIVARVPAGAVTGPVRVLISGFEANGPADFVVKLPPVVTGFAPATGVIGTAVTVTGANFDNTAVVRFNGRAAVTTFVSDTQLSAAVPTGATDGKLSVGTSAGIGFSANAFGLITVGGFTPTVGAAGTTVTFTGTNFDNSAVVRFAGVQAETTFVSPTTLTAVVPAGATTGLPSVASAVGTTPAVTPFRVVSVTGFTPSVAAAGATVTITGGFFDNTTVVRFADGQAAARTVSSSTQVVATVHDNAVAGPISVTVQSATAASAAAFTPALAPRGVTAVPGDGQVTLSWSPVAGASSYKVYWGTAPNVTKASPNFVASATSPYVHSGRTNGTAYYYVVTAMTSGIESVVSAEASATPVSSRPPAPTLDAIPLNIDLGKAGDTVHIYGTNFIRFGTTVLFNGTAAASVSHIDNTHLQVGVPAGATTGPVTVSTAGGDVGTAFPFRVASATGFSPASGKAGDRVTVTGTGFVNVTEVRFGGTDGPLADNVSVSGDTQVAFSVPATAVTGRIWVVQGRNDMKFGTSLPLVVGPPGTFTFLPAPTVSAVAVSGGVATVDGTNFTPGTTATLNGLSCPVAFVSATRILVTIPEGATSGNLLITTPGGSVQAGTPVAVAPTIASLSQLSSPMNVSVTILGSGFDDTSVVRFGGNVVAPSLVQSATRIDAVVPAAAVTGKVTVTTTAGGTAISADTYTVNPVVTGFASPAAAGATVIINGSGFDNTASVAFAGGVPAAATVVSATRIDAIVPPNASSGPIRVTTLGGAYESAASFLATPTIASLSPLSGVEGTVVTITGANFDNGAQVAFGGGVPAVVASRAYNRITAAVPAGATTGPVTVTTAGGVAASAPFTVHLLPVVSGFSPASGQVGDTVVVTGANFDNSARVFFNGILATVTGATATQLQAVVPPNALTGKISVSTTGGTVASAASFAVVGAPSFTGFTPSGGPVGTAVTINGTNFNVPGIAVAFNGVASTSVTVVNDNQVVAVVPNAASTGPVTVSTGLGSASSTANFTVSASVASFSPQIGTFGTAVAISGTGFTPFTTVRFNGLPSPRVTFVNPTQLSAQVPPGATSGPLTVADNVTTAAPFKVVSALWPTSPSSGAVGTPVGIAGGWFDNSVSVTFDGAAALSVTVVDNTHIVAVVPPGAKTARIGVTVQGVTAYTAYNFQVVPTIASVVNPRTGNATGTAGDNVVIGGTGFDPGAVVTFNGAPASLLSAGDNTLVAVVPNGATTGRIVVTTAGGSASSASDFAIAATAGGFSPSSGIHGTAVTISGQGFDITSKASFNGTAATTYFVSPVQLTAFVPDNATTGPVSIVSAGGTVVSPGTFSVVPAISSISPAIGTAGTTLTVAGFNFDGATRVFIGGTEATVASIAPLQVVATVPATVAAGQVTVATAGGTSAPSGGIFRYVSITGITPSAAQAGATVTITGSYFAGGAGTAVSFNGVPAQVVVLNNTTLQAVVPAGATTGPVSVTTGGVTVVSAAPFTVQPKLYDAREYFPLRLGDHAQRTDNTVTIMFRKVAVDNLVGVEEVRVPPDRYEESDLFAIDNVTGNVLRLGKFVGNPRTLIAFNPPIVIGTSGMAVGETIRTDYEAFNPETGFPEARWFEIRLDNVASVATPAGTFDNCLKLDWSEEGFAGSVWLAKGVGFVQESKDGKILSPKYIVAGGQAYGTPYSFNPGVDNVSGVYVNDSVIPEGGPANYGFATDRTVNEIVHNPPATTYAMTTYWKQGNSGLGSGSVSSGTLVAGNATDPQGVPVSFRVVHTPNAEGYVGQWWYAADNSVKYPLTGVLFHAIEPSPGDEAIYALDGGQGGIRDNYFSGPLAYAGDNNAWLRDAHFGLRDRGVPSGFQEWFSVRNGDLYQLGNSIWPVYVPALKSLPKRFVLNRVYTTYNWLDNTVSRFQVDAVDNVTVPAGNFPLSLRVTQTDSKTGYPDYFRRTWLTPDIRGMVHVKGTDGTKVEELVWYQAGGGSRGNYPIDVPTVASFSPASGAVGDTVSVYGYNFDVTAQLYFTGASGPVAASILSNTPDWIQATVPAGAVDGPVSVAQGGWTSFSRDLFDVTTSGPVTVTVSPDNVSIPAGASQPFSSVVTGLANGSTAWYVPEGPSGGSYVVMGPNDVVYNAPSTPGVYHLVAIASDNATWAQATINVYSVGSSISFAGKVTDLAGTPLAGATVAKGDNPAISTTTAGDGTFTLGGLPSGVPFQLRFSKAGYLDAYGATSNTTTNIVSNAAFVMYLPSDVSAWGLTGGRGAIRTRVLQSGSDNVYVAGATVSAQSALHPASPYTVYYYDGAAHRSGTGTFGNGIFLVPNVDNLDNVTVTASKPGWTFGSRSYLVHDNAVSQGRVAGSPTGAAVTPYTADGSTVLLDHFDGATAATVAAFSENGQACGGYKPAATPVSFWTGGIPGLAQGMTLIPPSGQPVGSTTYLQYPGGDLLSQSNGTVELWAYLSEYAKGGIAQMPYHTSCAGYTFSMSVNASGQLEAGAWAAFNLNSGAATVPLNAWTHLAATWGSGGAKLYINGVQVASDPNTGMPASGYGGSLFVNASGTMRIDELRVSSVQRTAFNLLSAPAVGVSVSPESASLPTGGIQTFTASVTGASDNSVSWHIQEGSPSGGTFFANGFNSVQYTAPDTPGVYHLVARSNQDNGVQATATITVTGGTAGGAYTVSGSVSYTGPKSGRIYVTLGWVDGGNAGYGTSIEGPGPFTIRGVRPGSYVVNAFLDAGGTGVPNANNPSIGSAPFDVFSDRSGVAVSLSDPGPVFAEIPAWINVNPGDGGAVVFWQTPFAGDLESARAYDVYWGLDNGVGPGNSLGSARVPARDDAHFLVNGLSNGTSYFFGVRSVADDNTASAVRFFGPVMVGTPPSGATVSGTATIPGLAPTGPLYVVVGDQADENPASVMRFVRIPSPGNPQAFAVAGVPDGAYEVFAFVDMNNNGIVDLGDARLPFDGPPIQVSGASVDNVNVTLATSGVVARVTTSHGRDGSDWYGVNPRVEEVRRRPVRVALTSAPAYVPVPIDIGISEWGSFELWYGIDATRPAVGDGFQFTVTYADNTSELYGAQVGGVLDSFATIVSPVGTVTDPGATTPVFEWAAPASPPPGFRYGLWVQRDMGGNVWDYWGMPPTQSSVAYNVDGRASQPVLASGAVYRWGVTVEDASGNQAQIMATFTPVDNTVPTDRVSVSGTVTVQGLGVPIAGALVSTSLDGSWTTTDASGAFFLQTNTPTGVGGYSIYVDAAGYQPFSQFGNWGDHPTGQSFNLAPSQGGVAVFVNPGSMTLPTSGSWTFNASVSGAADDSVTWSVQEGSPAGGTVFPNGYNSVLYTAPPVPGVYHLAATSNQDNTVSGVATITVTTETDHVSISGNVYVSGSGAPIQGATVSTSLDNSVAVTDSNGYFFLQTTYPTGVGSYTIAVDAPGYQPWSGTGNWGDHPGGQVFYLTPAGGPVFVSVSPDFAPLGPGGVQIFSAFVSGASDNTVTWFITEGYGTGGTFTQAGPNAVQYNAPSAPGTYHLVAVSNQDNTAQAQATITVSGGTVGGSYTVSGNVSYAGAKTGRIYVTVGWEGGGSPGYGTSIAGPGPFTIRGVQPGSYVVRAFLDAGGTGVPNYADPTGASGTINVFSDQSGIQVDLADPTPAPAEIPAWINVTPGDGAALLFWDTPFYGDLEAAKSYAVFWGVDSNVGPGNNLGSVSVPARDDGHFVVNGLTNGNNYFFGVQAIGSDDSASSVRFFGPVTIGTPPGGYPVSGTVSFQGVAPTGPLYVVVGDGSDSGQGTTMRIAKVASPASPQPFTVSGVPDGPHDVFAFVDMNNNGYVDVGDLVPPIDGPYFQLSGAAVDNVNVVLETGNASARVTTTHSLSGSEWYSVTPRVEAALKRPVSVTLVGAPPSVAVPVDIGLGDWGSFELWRGVPSRPNIGDNYVLAVTYADNTSETLTASVTRVLDSFPTIVSPVGTVEAAGATTPTFEWTAPASPPATFQYGLWVQPDMGGSVWDYWGMAPAQTSVAYNVDGGASQTALTSGNPYRWALSVQDEYGNQAQVEANFTPIDTTPPSAVDWTGINADSGPVGSVVVLTGQAFDDSAQLWFAGTAGPVAAPILSVEPNQIVATVPAGAVNGVLTLQVGSWTSPDGPWFTVTATPVPSVVVLVKPGSADLQPGQPYVFTWEVRNVADGSLAANQAVTWSAREGASGSAAGTWSMQTNVLNYTASSTPGDYTLVARSVADNNAYGLSFVWVDTNVPAPTAFTVSGTLTYAGSKTGRVYANLSPAGGGSTTYGVSFPSAASTNFSVRGVPPGSYYVKAWLDNGGTGVPNAWNPSGASSMVTVGSSNVGGVTLALADPAPGSAPAVPWLGGSADNGSVLLFWDTPYDGNGLELARRYNIYWNTSAAVGPASYAGRRMGVPARDDGHCFVGGLPNGVGYWFAITAVGADNVESAPQTFGPLTIGTPGGGQLLSGTVSFPGFTATGPLVVVAGDRYKVIPNPVSPQAYAIPGVPDGPAEMFAFIDMNNDNVVTPGDVWLTADIPVPQVAGAGITGLDMQLDGGNAVAAIRTNHGMLRTGGEWYNLSTRLEGQRKRAIRVTLIAAPAPVHVPVDLALNDWQNYEQWIGNGGRPNVGDAFVYSVRFADNTSELVTATVTAVLDLFATPTAPIGPVPGTTTPTFSWDAPAGMQPGYGYTIRVNRDGGGDAWRSDILPQGTTSIGYGSGGEVMEEALTNGQGYSWDVSVRDPYGNTSSVVTTFTPEP